MRHEEKFICSDRQIKIMKSRLRCVLPYDSNQSGDDYRIRSLYFDTADDRLYNESLNGIARRSKYRLRFYNMDKSLLRMEIKDTVGSLKQKRSAIVGGPVADDLISGPGTYTGDDDVLREVDMLRKTEFLHPVAIVDYRRTAFTYPAGNVRITFDCDIACTDRTEDLFDEHALLIPVMPQHKHILEVKYDGIFPGFIAKMLDIGSLEQVSFSKYAYSRSTLIGNGRKEDGYGF